jgi:hypothetical protein
MVKKIYVEELDMVFDVWGFGQCRCGNNGFVVYREDLKQWDYVHFEQCIPYNEEMLPNVKTDADPKVRFDSSTIDLKKSRAREEADKQFRRMMDDVAKQRKKLAEIRSYLEKTFPGIKVETIGSGFGYEGFPVINITATVTDPKGTGISGITE